MSCLIVNITCDNLSYIVLSVWLLMKGWSGDHQLVVSPINNPMYYFLSRTAEVEVQEHSECRIAPNFRGQIFS